MKTKHLFILLGITVIALIYFEICYFFINKSIENNTFNRINVSVNTMCENCKWDYVKSVSHSKDTFLVVIKIKKDDKNLYHQFIFDYNYNIVESIPGKPEFMR